MRAHLYFYKYMSLFITHLSCSQPPRVHAKSWFGQVPIFWGLIVSKKENFDTVVIHQFWSKWPETKPQWLILVHITPNFVPKTHFLELRCPNIHIDLLNVSTCANKGKSMAVLAAFDMVRIQRDHPERTSTQKSGFFSPPPFPLVRLCPLHIRPKRKIQRLLNVIFLNRNIFKPIDTLV